MIEAMPAIQTAIQLAQKLRELAKKAGDADLKMMLADLSDALGDARLEAADLKQQLSQLMDENLELRKRLDTKEQAEPTYDGDLYAFPGDDGRYCPVCWNTRQLKMKVNKLEGPWASFGNYDCPSCKATFN